MKSYGRIGFIARFKPLHNGGIILDEMCRQADSLVIGIGSSDKYNLRNPFTAEESKGMVDSYLSQRTSNYSVIYVPDFGHLPGCSDGQKWRHYVLDNFGQLDTFATSNEYVIGLLKNDYKIIHPASFLAPGQQMMIKAAQVRYEMATFGNWKGLVPAEVTQYLEKNGLVERFRRDFGLATIAELAGSEYWKGEDSAMEKAHVCEVD